MFEYVSNLNMDKKLAGFNIPEDNNDLFVITSNSMTRIHPANSTIAKVNGSPITTNRATIQSSSIEFDSCTTQKKNATPYRNQWHYSAQISTTIESTTPHQLWQPEPEPLW